MSRFNIQTHKSPKSLFSNFANQNSFLKNHQGYHNYDSPLSSTLRIQLSPRKNLSPLKYNTSSRNLNRSRSPIIQSKQYQNNLSTNRLSPFKQSKIRNNQEEDQSKSMSFTSLIRKSSNKSNDLNLQSKRTMEYSNGYNLQTDKASRQNTNLFKKLIEDINNKGTMNNDFSENSVKNKKGPQSLSNNLHYNSNKKIFINNVATIQSIQSPQQKDFIEQNRYYSQHQKIQTSQYEVYEKITTQHKNSSNKKPKNNNYEQYQRSQEKKFYNDQGNQVLSFKKISINQKNNMQFGENRQYEEVEKAINFNLTNSFGTINLKNQIIGENHNKKAPINPFNQVQELNQVKQNLFCHNQPEIIPKQNQQLKLDNFGRNVVSGSLTQSTDSLFASLNMIMNKVNERQQISQHNKQNESINMSMSHNQSMDLDMEPFLKRKD